jgi:hypothetical protein
MWGRQMFATLIRSLAFVALLAGSLPPAANAEPTANITLYSTEQEATKDCARDTVVWLNTPTGIYHMRGDRWYGGTKHGAFVCKSAADRAGYRPSKRSR